MTYLLASLFLFLALLVYFRVAVHFKIIDIPNARSSHHSFTIRGGGIIFLMAIIIAFAIHPVRTYYLPIVATLLISTVSFIDDTISLSWRLRFAVQALVGMMLIYYFHLYNILPFWSLLPILILVIATINAFNFMDGINGMTGLYNLIFLGTLQFINFQGLKHFVQPDMIWMPMLGCLVFLYFNFRKKAKCFAGDVGSITMAFWSVFLLMKLIVTSGHWVYFLLLSVYGVEAGLTIVHRIIRKENILEPHRLHIFQLLVNELGWSHIGVSLLYGFIQLIINFFILTSLPIAIDYPILISAACLVPLSLLYVWIKPYLMRLQIPQNDHRKGQRKGNYMEIIRGGNATLTRRQRGEESL